MKTPGTVVLLGFSEQSEPVFPGEPAAGMLLWHPRVQRGSKARQRAQRQTLVSRGAWA